LCDKEIKILFFLDFPKNACAFGRAPLEAGELATENEEYEFAGYTGKQ